MVGKVGLPPLNLENEFALGTNLGLNNLRTSGGKPTFLTMRFHIWNSAFLIVRFYRLIS